MLTTDVYSQRLISATKQQRTKKRLRSTNKSRRHSWALRKLWSSNWTNNLTRTTRICRCMSRFPICMWWQSMTLTSTFWCFPLLNWLLCKARLLSCAMMWLRHTESSYSWTNSRLKPLYWHQRCQETRLGRSSISSTLVSSILLWCCTLVTPRDLSSKMFKASLISMCLKHTTLTRSPLNWLVRTQDVCWLCCPPLQQKSKSFSNTCKRKFWRTLAVRTSSSASLSCGMNSIVSSQESPPS